MLDKGNIVTGTGTGASNAGKVTVGLKVFDRSFPRKKRKKVSGYRETWCSIGHSLPLYLAISKVSGRFCAKVDTNKCKVSGRLLKWLGRGVLGQPWCRKSRGMM